MEEKFRNGQANFVEFTEAKVNLAKAQSDRLQAKYEYLFRTKILAFYEGKPMPERRVVNVFSKWAVPLGLLCLFPSNADSRTTVTTHPTDGLLS